MKVAIVVLNYNGLNLLKIFIPQLIKNCLGLDFYVVDNGSDDDSVNYIINEYPNVKVIINEKNFGYAGGYNKSLNKINAELFICLNNDATFIDKKSVNNIIEVSEEDQDSLAIRKRSVVISGHRTSVSLENAFWFGLKEVAGRKGQTVNQLVTEIDSGRTGNLSSAIRVFILLEAKERWR